MRRLPTYPGQLAPTTLPLRRLVSNSCSAGLPPPSLSFSLPGPPPTVTHSLSPLSHKGVFGMFAGSLSPPGFEPSSTGQKRCVVPTELRRDVVCTVVLTYSALYPCIPLSVSLCLALSLLPPLCSLSSPSPGVVLVPLPHLTPPCMLSPVRHIAVRTAVCSAACRGTVQRLRIPGPLA